VAVNTSKGIVRFEAFELHLRAGELSQGRGQTDTLPFRILTMLLGIGNEKQT
jgi:hypothetical protein